MELARYYILTINSKAAKAVLHHSPFTIYFNSAPWFLCTLAPVILSPVFCIL